MQILRARFRRVTSCRLGRFALRTRVDRDDPVSFGKSVDLPTPNIGARAPARNKNQSRTGLAGLDNPQRYAFADIHLSLAQLGSGIRGKGYACCTNPGN